MDKKFEIHRKAIMIHKMEVADLMSKIAIEIMKKAFDHDNSKMEEPELSGFMEIIPELNKQKYMDSEYSKALKGDAIQHHYKNNDHHPEFFKNGCKDMNFVNMIEMLCDWISASKRYNGEVDFDEQQKRFNYSDDIKALLVNTMKILKE